MSTLIGNAIERATKDFVHRIDALRELEPLALEFEQAFGNCEDVTITVHSGIDLSHSGDKKSLAKVLRKVRKMGFEWRKDNVPKEPTDYLHFTCYRGEDWRTRQHIYISFSSTVCERVFVGTKKVEQEMQIYEMRCK